MVEQLKQDMIEAMKAKDQERLTTIRMVKAAMDKEHIDKKREINDDLLIEVVSHEVKTRNESIEEFRKGNREDLVKATEAEIEILKKYLPEQLSEDEVKGVIDEVITEVKPEGIRDMGKVMREATARLKGKANMSLVSRIVKEKLQ